MRAIVYTVVILLNSLSIAVAGSAAARVYVWTDQGGRIHITDEPPAKGAKLRGVIEYEPRPSPQPQKPSPPSKAEKAERRDQKVQCRDVFRARRNLRKPKKVAAAVRQRAQEARAKVRDLRDRIGFDDDEMDDFKDDLQRLEKDARTAEMRCLPSRLLARKLKRQKMEHRIKLKNEMAELEKIHRFMARLGRALCLSPKSLVDTSLALEEVFSNIVS